MICKIVVKKGWCIMGQQNYISDEQVVKRANCAVKIALEKKRAMDVPIFTYDRATQSICEVGSDGTKIQVCRRYNHGRYSERCK